MPGDIFPQLVTNYAMDLAQPLQWIYHGLVDTYHWLMVWRNEYVTIIPKSTNPKDLGGCRNISCTNLFSKILESFILEWLCSQVSPNMRRNQYGGRRGAVKSISLLICGPAYWKTWKIRGGVTSLFPWTLLKPSTDLTILTFYARIYDLVPALRPSAF